MTMQRQPDIFLELPDARAAALNPSLPMTPEPQRPLVQLDPEHPGFRDEAYRSRRNAIARLALDYETRAHIPDAPYTDEEHQLWQTILDALEQQHRRHACAQYRESFARLDLPRGRIPQLREVTAKVEELSGFRLEPVAGLVEPRAFLESLAHGVFLSTQYIRHHSAPLYTPEPDVVHEVVGHATTLACAPLAELNRLVGQAVQRTTSSEALQRLARVYWFTIEFGVVREAGVIKAYGSGLVSSAGELNAMHDAELRPFDLEAASRQEFDTTKYQPILFCADSFDEMHRRLRDYLIAW